MIQSGLPSAAGLGPAALGSIPPDYLRESSRKQELPRTQGVNTTFTEASTAAEST